MSTALIFGAAGQDGYYLTRSCVARNLDVVGIDRTGAAIEGDVSDFAFVQRCIRDHQPHYVFHLAAASSTRHEALFDNHAAISSGTLNILEAVYRAALPTRIFLCGSGVQFQNDGTPISEETPFAGTSPYAVARIHSVYAARYYRKMGVRAYVGYLFHHESPRRPEDHVSQLVARAAKQIANGSSQMLEIGSLAVEKEWTFAGDVTEAMLLLLSQDVVHEAIIGTGETHSIQEWMEECFGLVGLDWRLYVREKPGYIPEYPRLCANPATMRRLGWKPQVSFKELAAMMMSL
jgi:GDPmannose 4,6-dehydratase